MELLLPILRVSQILGVFPLQMTAAGNLHFDPHSSLSCRSPVSLLITIGYLLYLCFQFLTCIYHRKSALQFVVVLCWLISSLNASLILLIIFKRSDLCFFFDKYNCIKANHLPGPIYAISSAVARIRMEVNF